MKTAVVYHFFAHYRAPVLTSLMNAGAREFVLVGARTDPWGSIKAWDIPEGVPFREAPCITVGRHLLWQRKVARIALSREFDSIIFLGDAAWPATWVAALLARLSGKQVYFWTHGYTRYDSGLKRLARKLFYEIADGLLLYGHMAKMVAIAEGFNPARLHVIYNSLDYDAQKAARECITPDRIRARRASLFPDPTLPIVICTSRLTRVRRLDMLIDAVALLNASGSPTNLLLVGDGPEAAALEQHAASKGVDVHFFGACYEAKVLAELIMAADLTVAPGAVGLTAIHSLAFGTPVVTHDSWDHQMPEWEAVVEGKTGGFFQEGDVVSLSHAIRRWGDRSQPRDRVRKDCIDIVERFYNPAHQTRCILHALGGHPADDLLSTRAAGPAPARPMHPEEPAGDWPV